MKWFSHHKSWTYIDHFWEQKGSDDLRCSSSNTHYATDQDNDPFLTVQRQNSKKWYLLTWQRRLLLKKWNNPLWDTSLLTSTSLINIAVSTVTHSTRLFVCANSENPKNISRRIRHTFLLFIFCSTKCVIIDLFHLLSIEHFFIHSPFYRHQCLMCSLFDYLSIIQNINAMRIFNSDQPMSNDNGRSI